MSVLFKEQNCEVVKAHFKKKSTCARRPKDFFFGKCWPCFAISQTLFHNKILGSLALFIKNNEGGLPEEHYLLFQKF